MADMGSEKRGFRERFFNKKAIIIAAVTIIVIGAGAGAGLVKASDNPAFCQTCHIMQKYYDSWHAGDLLAKKHADADLKCHDCHDSSITVQAKEGIKFITGNYKDPLDQRKMPREFCLKCHDDFDAVKAKTNFEESNPHDSHKGEQDCYLCHSMHRQSRVMCLDCHNFKWIDELDDSWVK